MARDLVLTLDIGTGSVRALVYAISEGTVLSAVSRNAEIDHPAPFRAQFDPEQWKSAALAAMQEAVIQAKVPAENYLGITVASLRQGFVLIENEGVPIGPGVLNYDRRGALGIPTIQEKINIEDLYALTGHWHAPELTLPKLVYLQEHESETWSRVSKLLFVHDWMLFVLTGEICTNATMVCGGQMADIKKRIWAFDLLEELGIPKAVLPPVMETGNQVGGLLAEIASKVGLLTSTPIFVGGGDTQFGSLGAGGMQPGSVVIVGGSTTPLMLTSTSPIIDTRRFPWVSTHLDSKLWAVEMNAGNTGMIYKWFLKTFGAAQIETARTKGIGSFEDLNDLAMDASLGAKGLRAIASSPRWAQDTWENKAPFVFMGFNTSTTLGEFARSILESVCYAVRGNLTQLERIMGSATEKIIYTGGTAAPNFWAQMMADVLGRSISVPEMMESAGAAGAQVVLWGVGDKIVIPPPTYRVYQPDERCSSAYQPHYEDYINKFETLQTNFSEDDL